MKLETFFEKFDQFADAPDAMAKMRELVLHLAVTGNLVRQNSTEQPAEELLIEVRHSRDDLVKEGIIRRIEALPPLTTDDVPFECPAGWAWVRFGEISSSYRGHNPPKSVFKDKPAPGYVRFIQQRDFRTEDYAVYVPESRHLKLVKKGEIVMAAYGNIGNTCRTVEGAFNVAIAKVMEIPPVERDYIDLLIRSDFIRGALEKVSSRVAVSSMSSDHMRSLAVPLPPLAEQKRIVAKVNELMALCDRLEAQQQERGTRHAALARASLARFADAPTPANLHFLFHPSYAISPADLRKSILTLAVQGKLVPFDNDGEEQTVGDHIEFQNGYAFKSEWFKPSGMRLCRNANVSHGFLDWRESAFVDDKVAKEFERFALSEGDIVLSLDRPLITTGLKVARVTKADLPCLLLQRVAKPVPKHDQLDLSYFLIWLNSSEFVDSIDPGRSNGVPHISTRQVQRLPFVLPPLAEQRRIVAKVEQLMALVDALETQLAASRATAENLLAAVVAELTEGTHASPAC